ncbi:MAG: hypothetical protein M1816_001837 [Peltula sp. TS41687]|nr:MAG: hypothetical protein M1816_001837 [Peltula sp. TS41687]
MGWFWGVSNKTSKEGEDSNGDPLKNLDPALRDFLDKESPVKYTSTSTTSTTAATTIAEEEAEPTTSYTDQITKTQQKDSETGAPAESLFPDGRYAHLWRTYTPLREVEAATKSEQEKLLDMIDGYKERKAQIGRAALENCSLEHLAVSDCFRYGGWKSRMTMCRAENREFEKCYTMQARFLKALGYLSTYERAPEVDERIQMHADKLYHRMLEQEAAVEKAKAEGSPIPTFEPLLPGAARSAESSSSDPALPPAPTTATTTANLKPSVQAQIEKRLKGLGPRQRALEEQAIAAEIAAGQQLAGQIDEHRMGHDKARQKRREEGKETFSDKVTRWFRF